MERTAFTLLHDMESSWWYRGRALVVRTTLGRLPALKNLRVLDFGAGYGGMQKELARFGSVEAFEPDSEALAVARTKPYAHLFTIADEALRGPYDLIGLFDVVEHLEDDRQFLSQARGALAEQGRLVITVPAMPFLWSAHDVSHHHFRRYTKSTLRALLSAEGYEVEYISYWNCALFVPAALMRLLGQSGEGSFAFPRIVDSMLYAVIWVETLVMRLIPLPFGISLIALARKREV